MSAAAGALDSRLRATARSEWIKFRSVRSGPFALSATALTVVAGAWLLGDANRGSYLAASPVKSHVQSMLGKLGVRDRLQATVAAYDAGLVRPHGS